jgi:hypothetical protein
LGILNNLEAELGKLSDSLGTKNGDVTEPAASVIVERSLFIGRLLFALRYHSSHVPLILSSPRQWVKDSGGAAFARLSSPTPRHSRASFDSAVPFTPRRHTFDSPRSPGSKKFDSPRRQPLAAAASLFGADDSSNPRLDELNKTLKALCITAHTLWITWVAAELSDLLSYALNGDDSLASSTPLRVRPQRHLFFHFLFWIIRSFSVYITLSYLAMSSHAIHIVTRAYFSYIPMKISI